MVSLDIMVENYALKYPNIVYVGYINGLKSMIPYYLQSNFFVLNSKKTATWEELFGISLIETMASGLVPLVVNHSGPKEIVSHQINGYIFYEGQAEKYIDYVVNEMDKDEYDKLRIHAILDAKKYHSSKISEKWKSILD